MIGLFEGLGLLEDVDGSVGEVVLELEILVGEEIVDRLSLDFWE